MTKRSGHRLVLVVAVVSVLAAGCGTTVPLAQQPNATGGGDGLGVPGAVTSPGGTASLDAVAGTTASAQSAGGAGATQPASGAMPGAATPGAPAGGAPTGRTSIASAVPAKGIGWDAKHVYMGIPYQDQASSASAANAFGLNGLIGVEYRQAARAVLADVNKHGGLFGREVKPVFAEFPPLPNQTGQSQCATWTEDNEVFAVTNTFYSVDSLYACLANAKVPFGDGIISPMADEVLARFSPYAHKFHVTSTTKLDPALVTRLGANKYFRGWDTLRGEPGPNPVKVGVLCRDDHESTRVQCDAIQQLLKERGYDVAEAFHLSGPSDQTSGAVLRFKSDSVTHVFSTTTDILFFMLNANNQNYYPRYALTSLNAPFLLESNAPKRQLRGALGVGFSPYIDVPKPPASRAHAHCLAVMKKGGIDVPPASSAHMQTQSICDEIYVWVHAARAGGGLDPAHVLAGLDRIRDVYRPGAVFANGLSSTRKDEAAAVRDLGYGIGCSCFRYLSTRNWRS